MFISHLYVVFVNLKDASDNAIRLLKTDLQWLICLYYFIFKVAESYLKPIDRFGDIKVFKVFCLYRVSKYAHITQS